MKRATSMLGALAMLAAGFLFAAPAAHASCTYYPIPPISTSPASNKNNWPRVENGTSGNSLTQYCADLTPTTDSHFTVAWQRAQGVGNAKSTTTPKFLSELYSDWPVQFYFFTDYAGANSEWGTSIPSNVLGNTQVTGGGTIIRVGIWKKRADGTDLTDTQIKGVINHELGHAYDFAKFNSTDGYPSDASPFTTALSADKATFNAKTRAQAFGSLSFSGSACESEYNDTTNYSNWDVAVCAWPGDLATNYEIFATFFGKRVGGSIVNTELSTYVIKWATFSHLADYMDDIASGVSPF